MNYNYNYFQLVASNYHTFQNVASNFTVFTNTDPNAPAFSNAATNYAIPQLRINDRAFSNAYLNYSSYPTTRRRQNAEDQKQTNEWSTRNSSDQSITNLIKKSESKQIKDSTSENEESILIVSQQPEIQEVVRSEIIVSKDMENLIVLLENFHFCDSDDSLRNIEVEINTQATVEEHLPEKGSTFQEDTKSLIENREDEHKLSEIIENQTYSDITGQEIIIMIDKLLDDHNEIQITPIINNSTYDDEATRNSKPRIYGHNRLCEMARENNLCEKDFNRGTTTTKLPSYNPIENKVLHLFEGYSEYGGICNSIFLFLRC
jgi:hypothetical protein